VGRFSLRWRLKFEVSGEVVELNIKEGDFVKKDKYSVGSNQIFCNLVMIVLLRNEFTAGQFSRCTTAIKTTEENFKNVAATYKRNQELFEKRVISASEMDKSSPNILQHRLHPSTKRDSTFYKIWH
jgi:HlyD family secretion protein